MRSDHFAIFKSVAANHTCWIGLREPNPLGDKWIGRPNHVPKPLTCKAKTATNSNHRYGGLVVSPIMCPDAFSRPKLDKAKESWQDNFLVGGRLPAGFGLTENGLVTIRGARIHPDYDLMSVVRSGERDEMIFTTHAEAEAMFDDVQWAINSDLGIDMIQHGAEFMWTGGIGAADFEYVLWFGPNGKFRRCPSSNQIAPKTK